MAEDQTKKPAVESKGGPPAIVGILLPALLAAGSAFGGAKLAGGGAPAHGGHEATHVEAPGPTEVLDPFLVTIADPQRPHVIKLTLAVELKASAKAEHFKSFVPRVRDATLTYLRSLTFDEASNPARFEQMRTELLDRFVKIGVHDAEHVLITEFVAQ